MKVSNETQISKDILTKPVKKGDEPKGPDFKTVLKDIARKNGHPAEKTADSMRVEPAGSKRMSEMRLIDRSFAAKKTGSLLTLLDEYQTRLADPSASLKDLHSLLDGLKTEQKELAPLLDLFPEWDELREIVNRTLIHISVESIKFNRGDYLD